MSKGKQPRLLVKVHKKKLSDEGSLCFITARRWAWKQPFFKESVTAHWPRVKAPKILRA